MYYDLIASLPQLPYFERGDRLPITPLRLEQRLRRLRPEHAAQLNPARALVRWRPERMTAQSDAALVAAYARLVESPLEPPLREYVAFRLTQQTLLAALRRRRDGLNCGFGIADCGFQKSLFQSAIRNSQSAIDHHLRTHWDQPAFGLEHVYPWLSEAHERLSAGDALGLERLMMDLNWRWLTRRAEPAMFGFEAVVAFVFKWDMLQAWLACDAGRARIRFTQLIDEVTKHEHV
jgi:Protein of unknown function (DUF2764)